ncbi:MAG TPA: hypothetical protein VN442_24780 [Bryobacteraceae bacterium]|nr:hypothetical protein [Bryobacteraceae bacterium]
MSGSLEAASSRLRAAVEAGAFGPALALLPEFRREFDGALAGVPPGGAAAREIAARARDLLEWARRATLCSQTHLAAQLEALACLNAYRGARREHRWEMEG